MPSTYEASPRPHLLHRGEQERVSRVPLRGVPQIRDALNRFWQTHGFDLEPPELLRRETDDAIAAAMREHHKRRLALLQASASGPAGEPGSDEEADDA